MDHRIGGAIVKKLIILILSIIFLTGCGVLDGGNYDKNRNGYVLSNEILISYHTNDVGEIDVFMIDKVVSFFTALELSGFDVTELEDNSLVSSFVTEEELISCGITEVTALPRFIRVDNDSFYYNVAANGNCSYDEYDFHRNGFDRAPNEDVRDTSPIERLNITMFEESDFTINTFDHVLFIEEVSYSALREQWEKDIVIALPMSVRQQGNLYENNDQLLLELSLLENYVLRNQSINLLEVKEDYLDENVNNIWSDDTIEILGRDHEIIKSVRLKQTKDILDVIEDTLSRLGMF